jgi:hypothetical protein
LVAISFPRSKGPVLRVGRRSQERVGECFFMVDFGKIFPEGFCLGSITLSEGKYLCFRLLFLNCCVSPIGFLPEFIENGQLRPNIISIFLLVSVLSQCMIDREVFFPIVQQKSIRNS